MWEPHPFKQSPNQPPGVSGLVVHHSISGPSPNNHSKRGVMRSSVHQIQELISYVFLPQSKRELFKSSSILAALKSTLYKPVVVSESIWSLQPWKPIAASINKSVPPQASQLDN